MKVDNIHKYKNPPVKKNVSSAIFVNSIKHKNRRLQRINYKKKLSKPVDPEALKELQKKIRKDNIKSTAISVMLSVLLVFALLSLFYWTALK